jgi:leader peptidase (prepilin peptidase) / N-methyltransferase
VSPARVAIAVAAAALVAASFVRFDLWGDALVAAFVVVVLAVVSVIDLEQRIIPNLIVLPATVVVLAARIALEPDRWVEWVGAAAAAAGFLLFAHIAYPAGMGMGDVKLALCLGAALGWPVFVALFLGLLAAAILGIAFIVREGRAGRKKAIPFGPFLALGAIVTLFLGGT